MNKLFKYMLWRQVIIDTWWLLKPLRKLIKALWSFELTRFLFILQCLYWSFLLAGYQLSTYRCKYCNEERHKANFFHYFWCPVKYYAKEAIAEWKVPYHREIIDEEICTRSDHYPQHLSRESLQKCNKIHRICEYKGKWVMCSIKEGKDHNKKHIEYTNIYK